MDDQSLLAAFQDASAEPAVPVEGATPVAPETEPSTPTPAEKTPLALADDDLVEYKVGGQVLRKPWKEVMQTQALLPGDYTRKMQALADDRRAFLSEREQFSTQRAQVEQTAQQAQAEMDAYKQRVAQVFRNPQMLEALYHAAAVGAQGQQGQPNPAQYANQAGQLPNPQAQPAAFDPSTLPNLVQQMVEQRFGAERQAQLASQRDNERATTLERHVESILTANPVLKAIPGINDYIYGRVLQMSVPGQTTVDEALQHIEVVSADVAQRLNQHYVTNNKEQAVAQAKLKNGIEPPGGSPTLPKARTYDRRKGLDDPDMEADAIAMFKQQLGAA